MRYNELLEQAFLEEFETDALTFEALRNYLSEFEGREISGSTLYDWLRLCWIAAKVLYVEDDLRRLERYQLWRKYNKGTRKEFQVWLAQKIQEERLQNEQSESSESRSTRGDNYCKGAAASTVTVRAEAVSSVA